MLSNVPHRRKRGRPGTRVSRPLSPSQQQRIDTPLHQLTAWKAASEASCREYAASCGSCSANVLGCTTCCWPCARATTACQARW